MASNKMPYISKVYRESGLMDEETRQSCLAERNKGNVSVIFRTSRKLVNFYVGRDASIQWILESFRDDRFQGEPSSIVCTFYIPEEKQYHRAKRISDRTASIEELFQQQDIQIVYNFD